MLHAPEACAELRAAKLKNASGEDLTVNLPAVLDLQDGHHQPVREKFANQSEIADPKSAKSGKTAEQRFREASRIGMMI